MRCIHCCILVPFVIAALSSTSMHSPELGFLKREYCHICAVVPLHGYVCSCVPKAVLLLGTKKYQK